jgi:hypothetical protein
MWIVESSLDSPVQSGKNFSVSSTAGGNGNFLFKKMLMKKLFKLK